MLIVLDKLNSEASFTFDTCDEMTRFICNAYFSALRNGSFYGHTIHYKDYKFYEAYITTVNDMTVKIHFKECNI